MTSHIGRKLTSLSSHSALAVELTHLLVFWLKCLSSQLFAQYKRVNYDFGLCLTNKCAIWCLLRVRRIMSEKEMAKTKDCPL